MKVCLLNLKSRVALFVLAFSFLGLNSAVAQSLDLVCENVTAAQTNFHKGYFENSFITSFSQLILQNISPIPDNRFSPIDTLKNYTNIFFIKEVPENYFILIKELEKDSINQ